MRSQPYGFEVIVVDDGSSDKTVESCRHIADNDPSVRIIENEHYGKGYTVRTGMLAAKGKIVLFTDADLSVPISDIDLLLPWFEKGYDVVFGSREGGGAEQRVKDATHKMAIKRLFNALLSTAFA